MKKINVVLALLVSLQFLVTGCTSSDEPQFIDSEESILIERAYSSTPRRIQLQRKYFYKNIYRYEFSFDDINIQFSAPFPITKEIPRESIGIQYCGVTPPGQISEHVSINTAFSGGYNIWWITITRTRGIIIDGNEVFENHIIANYRCVIDDSSEDVLIFYEK